jgi:uncharacterized protein
VPIERSGRRIGAARIAELARDLLDASELCAIATATPAGRPHVNTAYFAWDADLSCVWLSDPAARHSRNVRANPPAAIAVYDSRQSWGGSDRGIQLFGTAGEATGHAAAEAAATYSRRFPGYDPGDLAGYRFYRLQTARIKLFDETALGSGVFVTATVGPRGRLVWERTEIYRAGRSDR